MTPTTLATLHGVVWPDTCGGETCGAETCGREPCAWATAGVANVKAMRAAKTGRIMVVSFETARDNARRRGRFTGNRLEARPAGRGGSLPQIPATHSISTSNGPGHDGTCRKIRAGASSGKYRSYTALNAAKCDGSGVQ